MLHIIPKTFVGAFAEGDILQVLLISILTGAALARMGERAEPITHALHLASQVFFTIVCVRGLAGAARGVRRDGLHRRQRRACRRWWRC